MSAGGVQGGAVGGGTVTGPLMDDLTQQRLKGNFDRVAAMYAVSRPGYPDAAVDWLVDGQHRDVLDLGAGSGALTRSLAGRAASVVAAEPGWNLLSQLRAASPATSAVQTIAERLPFADHSFDVVTVATAFHWFEHDRALPEIARVLTPGGHLALVWNMRSVAEPWTQELDRVMRSAQPPTLQGHWGTDSVQVLNGSTLFGEPEYAEFAHAQRVDRAGLVNLVGSRSYVIALDPAERGPLLAQVAAIFDVNADADGTLEMPWLCQCWRSTVHHPAAYPSDRERGFLA